MAKGENHWLYKTTSEKRWPGKPSPPVGPSPLVSKGLEHNEFCKQIQLLEPRIKMGCCITSIDYNLLLTSLLTCGEDNLQQQICLLEAAKRKKKCPQSPTVRRCSVHWGSSREIARLKMPDLNAFKVESAMKFGGWNSTKSGTLHLEKPLGKYKQKNNG